MATWNISAGDYLYARAVKIRRNGKPLDLTSYTAKFLMLSESGTSIVAETTTGVTAQPTTTFTVDTSADTILANEHLVEDGDEVLLSTTGSLPGGLATSTRYYAVAIEPNAFRVSTSPDGVPINITSAGSGTHTYRIIGHVQRTFTSTSLDTPGVYHAYFRLYSGSDRQTVPDTEPVYVHIRSAV